MNVGATDYMVNRSRRDGIENCVRSHIVVSRDMGLPESLEIVPGDHISKYMIYNGVVSGQEKYHFIFFLCHMLFKMHCAHNFTHYLTSLCSPGHKNLFLSLKRALYSPMCPALGPA